MCFVLRGCSFDNINDADANTIIESVKNVFMTYLPPFEKTYQFVNLNFLNFKKTYLVLYAARISFKA